MIGRPHPTLARLTLSGPDTDIANLAFVNSKIPITFDLPLTNTEFVTSHYCLRLGARVHFAGLMLSVHVRLAFFFYKAFLVLQGEVPLFLSHIQSISSAPLL
jgi:hypothetical protein